MGRPRLEHPTLRRRPVPVYFSARDLLAIEDRAAACGLSMSSYLRAAGLGKSIQPANTLALVRALAAASDDLVAASAAIGGRADAAGRQALARLRDRLAKAAELL